MKRGMRKAAALFLGAGLLGAMLLGALALLGTHGLTSAVETPNTTAKLSVDKSEALPGDIVTLTIELSTVRTDCQWGTVAILVQPKNSDHFQYIELSDTEMEIDSAFIEKVYEPTLVRSTKEKGILFSIPFKGDYDDNGAMALSTSEYPAYTMKAKLKLAESVPADTVIDLSIPKTEKYAVGYFEGSSIDESSDSGADGSLAVADTSIKVRQIGTDNALSKLELSIGSETPATFTATDDAAIPTGLTYDYAKPEIISAISIIPTLSDETYAKAYIAAGSTPPEQTEANLAESGKEKNIALTSEIRTVTILVKAESGDTKTYTVTIVDKFVALSDLVIEVGTKTEGVTKIGLGEGVAFDPETLTYTVDVPSDYASSETGVKITPTVAEGHGIQTAVALAGTNSSPENNSVASGSSVQVTGIANDGSLTLTLTASDDATEKAYTITFKLWSVETGTLTVKVQGAEKQYESDPEKESESVHFYFLLSDEAECKGKFIISSTVADIPIQVRVSSSETPEDYDAEKEYGAGTYEIILTAPAGNKAKYIAVITQQEFLELVEDSAYDFLLEESIDEDGDIYLYRRSYKQMNVTHGFEGKDVRIVLGHIKPETSVNAFLENIVPSQRNMIRLYTNKNQLIYNEGSPAEDITEEELNSSDDYRISTSWYLQFGGTAEAPLETVYLSVLGDVNSDGYVDARDITRINQYIKEVVKFDALEVRLAAYVSNKGYISAFDISGTNKVIKEVKKIEDYYYKPKPQEAAK